MAENITVVDVERSISNEIQVDLIRSQDFESNNGENGSNIDAVGTLSILETDINATPDQAGVVEIEEQVEIPTENEITESTDNEQQIIPAEFSVQVKVNDVVRTRDGQEGTVDHDYGDGQVRVDLGDKILFFPAGELTLVKPAQAQQQPKFELYQVVRSKKGFKNGVVKGFARDGRLIVEWRIGRKQFQTEVVDLTDVD